MQAFSDKSACFMGHGREIFLTVFRKMRWWESRVASQECVRRLKGSKIEARSSSTWVRASKIHHNAPHSFGLRTECECQGQKKLCYFSLLELRADFLESSPKIYLFMPYCNKVDQINTVEFFSWAPREFVLGIKEPGNAGFTSTSGALGSEVPAGSSEACGRQRRSAQTAVRPKPANAVGTGTPPRTSKAKGQRVQRAARLTDREREREKGSSWREERRENVQREQQHVRFVHRRGSYHQRCLRALTAWRHEANLCA